jgi:RNA polymerase sigma factor (sigma-70 family)
MATHGLDGALRHLRVAVRSQGEEADASLLERYLQTQDEAAFESLVLRHGPMVLGVCRRVLANDDDAEDAFQATFLVLLRKARSVRKRGALGAWLYGVAYRTALEARRAMAKRRAKEAKARPRAVAPPEGDDELREVLDQELAALPEHYRAAIVLCDLEGMGRKQAARELGCPEGTVASRLDRGRSMLAKRLARRGLATGSVAVVSQAAGLVSLPAALVSSTVKAAGLFAAGAAGAVSANVSSLIERVVRTMLVVKLRAVTVVVLFAGTIGSGAGWLWHQAAAQPGPANPPAARTAEGDRAEEEKLRQELKLLQSDLRKALERAAALEAKLKGAEDEPGEVLFQGKPASYWCKAVKDRDPGYRQAALKALAAIAKVDRAVVPVVAVAMNDEEGEVASEAARLLGHIGAPAVPHVIDALKDARQRERGIVFNAIRGMGRDAAPAVPVLIPLLKSRSPSEHVAAAWALESIGPDARSAVLALIDLLKGKETASHQAVAAALGAIGTDAWPSVPYLIELLKGPDRGVRGAASQALGKIGPGAKEAVPSLIALLNSKDRSDYVNAAIALGGIGPDARPAIPALLEVLHQLEGNSWYAQVFEAIEKINPEAAAKVKGR